MNLGKIQAALQRQVAGEPPERNQIEEEPKAHQGHAGKEGQRFCQWTQEASLVGNIAGAGLPGEAKHAQLVADAVKGTK